MSSQVKVIETKKNNLVVKDGQKVAIFTAEGLFLSARDLNFWEYLSSQVGVVVHSAREFGLSLGNFQFPQLYYVIEERGSSSAKTWFVNTLGTWEQVCSRIPGVELGVFDHEEKSYPGEGYMEFSCYPIAWEQLEEL